MLNLKIDSLQSAKHTYEKRERERVGLSDGIARDESVCKFNVLFLAFLQVSRIRVSFSRIVSV